MTANLDPIRPMTVERGTTDAGMRPRIDWVNIASLRVDHSYQRPVDSGGQRNIARIVSEFSWARFSPVVITTIPDQPGLYALIDVQRRTTAALSLGYKTVPAMIVDLPQADQAKVFAAINGNVTRVTPLQLFKAARTAGEPWAMAINNACSAAGIEALTYPVSKANMKPMQTIAIGTLRQAVTRFGEDRLKRALKAEARKPEARRAGYFNSDVIRTAVGIERPSAYSKPQAEVPSAGVEPAMRPGIDTEIRDRKARGQSLQVICAQMKLPYARVVQALDGGET